MNKKRDLFSDIFTWFLIIISVCSLWGLGLLTGLKVREIDSNTPNIVLNEKKANDNDLDYYTPNQSGIYSMFITSASSTYPFQNVYALKFNSFVKLDMDDSYIYNVNGYFDICLSSSLRYDSTINYYNFSFNDNAIQSFDFVIDYEISLNDFTNIAIVPYIDAIGSSDVDTTLEIYINDEYYTEVYFNYQFPTTFSSIYQYFDSQLYTELVNKDIIDNYTLGYDRGYYNGKLDGYDEGYYDKEDEYNATDSAFEKVWSIISNAFASVFNVFNIELFSGIKLFHVLAIPLIISVLYFVIKILAK